jgi:hypothetical protein
MLYKLMLLIALMRVTCPAYLVVVDVTLYGGIAIDIQIVNLLIVQLNTFSCYFIFVMSSDSPQYTVLRRPHISRMFLKISPPATAPRVVNVSQGSPLQLVL